MNINVVLYFLSLLMMKINKFTLEKNKSMLNEEIDEKDFNLFPIAVFFKIFVYYTKEDDS